MPSYFIKEKSGPLWFAEVTREVTQKVDMAPAGFVTPAVSTAVAGRETNFGMYSRATGRSSWNVTLSRLSDYAQSVSARRKAHLQEVKARDAAEKLLKLIGAAVDAVALVLPMMRIGSVSLRLALEFAPTVLQGAKSMLAPDEFDTFSLLVDLLKDPALKQLWGAAERVVPGGYRFVLDIRDQYKTRIERYAAPIKTATNLIQAYTEWDGAAPPIRLAEDDILDSIHRFRYVADPKYSETVDKFLAAQEHYRQLRAAALKQGNLQSFDELVWQENLLLTKPDPSSFPAQAPKGPVATPSPGTRIW